VLISDRAQWAALQGRVTALGLKNVVFQPCQPRERLRKFLGPPDIHVISLDKRLEGLIVANKSVGVLAMERPVLWFGLVDGEAAKLIKGSGCSVPIPTGDAALAQALRESRDDHAIGGTRLRTMVHLSASPQEYTISKARCLGSLGSMGSMGSMGSNNRTLGAPITMTFVIHIASSHFRMLDIPITMTIVIHITSLTFLSPSTDI
jgi:hypothetical protein